MPITDIEIAGLAIALLQPASDAASKYTSLETNGGPGRSLQGMHGQCSWSGVRGQRKIRERGEESGR